MWPETAAALLEEAVRRLAAAGCATPQLDARLLLQHAARLSREDLILDPGRVLEPEAARQFRGFVVRREAREPVSRILGEREFYGRAFRITPDVLDPRPDTETLVEAALGLLPQEARILDLGTGSGAIIVTLLAERPDAAGVATDVSAAALDVARGNAMALGVADRLTLLHGSWFEPVAGQFDLIVSNPPYIPRAAVAGLESDVRDYDPTLALTDGGDGLGSYRAIAAGAGAHLAEGGHVAVEIGASQSEDVEGLFATAGLRLFRRDRDLGGHIRCLTFVRH
jgi:release factor glutamine methyltransferase